MVIKSLVGVLATAAVASALECSMELPSQSAIDFLTKNTDWAASCDFTLSDSGQCIFTTPSTMSFSFSWNGVPCTKNCWVKLGLACGEGTVEIAEPTGGDSTEDSNAETTTEAPVTVPDNTQYGKRKKAGKNSKKKFKN